MEVQDGLVQAFLIRNPFSLEKVAPGIQAPCHPKTQFPDHARSHLAEAYSAKRTGPGRTSGALLRLN